MAYVLASFFDRLLEGSVAESPANAPGYCAVEAYVASVARDIEALLNTRNARHAEQLPGILDFGIPDFSSYSTANHEHRSLMMDAIKRAIEVHDGRLQSVRVALGDDRGEAGTLAFAITGQLSMTPHPRPVNFQATFHSSALRFSVALPGTGRAY